MNNRDRAKAEKKVPAAAVRALTAASKRALASGLPVVAVVGGDLCRIEPSGERVVLRTLPPPMKVAPGTKFRLRPRPAADRPQAAPA